MTFLSPPFHLKAFQRKLSTQLAFDCRLEPDQCQSGQELRQLLSQDMNVGLSKYVRLTARAMEEVRYSYQLLTEAIIKKKNNPSFVSSLFKFF